MIPKEARIAFLVLAVFVLIGILPSTFFIVGETQQVVITQFGKLVGKPITEAGLNMKLPFIQKANYFEKRVLKWDGSPNQIPTRDKKYIWVDTTARWRIKEPLKFLRRVRNDMAKAMSRLDGIIDPVVRDHVSKSNLVELVRSEGWEVTQERIMELPEEERQIYAMEDLAKGGGLLIKGRQKITRDMLEDASSSVPEFGIELLDIRIKRINYVKSVQEKVFERMISERKRISAQLRSEGEGKRAEILGEMERDLAEVRSKAFRKSQGIRGQADAETTSIYAEAFGRNPEFFEFYRSLGFYRDFSNPRSTFVMTGDADLFKYLKRAEIEKDN
jgi:membrane protease subunit HflC